MYLGVFDPLPPMRLRLALSAAALALAAPASLVPDAAAQPSITALTAAQLDTVQAGPLDGGKMWLFEAPPTAYLQQTYGFTPEQSWYDRARLASLRIPGCSAAFVTATGLIATNHHCSVDHITAVSRPGEGLLDKGFYAATRAAERRVEGMTADQAIAVADVTAEVEAAMAARNPQTDAERNAAQRDATEAVRVRLLRDRGIDPAAENADIVVQVVPLYQGGRFSAYTYRRYRDVRLVFAPEERLGFFGGDPDNFTYPRYALDYAFFRIYEGGRPVVSPNYFPLSARGMAPGEPVFVIGNPGSTSRGLTGAQLGYQRDVVVPMMRDALDRRIAVLDALIATRPANVDVIRTDRFSLSNSAKVYHGRTDALGTPYLMARRSGAERALLAARPEAKAHVDAMAAVVAEQTALAPKTRAYQILTNPSMTSATMQRAIAAVQASKGLRGAADRFAGIDDLPPIVERGFLDLELATLRDYAARSGLALTVPASADALLTATAMESKATARVDAATDPAVAFVASFYDDLAGWASAMSGLNARSQTIARDLGRARFAAYGASVPPDATFSLRFTDGVVSGYSYNGTLAPPFTTLNGLYDRHASFGVGVPAGEDYPWKLPQRWIAAKRRVRTDTPLNFTSTSDTIGGNSGSPAVNRSLELVGLNFDRTIEGMTRDYLYWAGRGRNVMVDVRAIEETLQNVYGATALLTELRAARRR